MISNILVTKCQSAFFILIPKKYWVRKVKVRRHRKVNLSSLTRVITVFFVPAKCSCWIELFTQFFFHKSIIYHFIFCFVLLFSTHFTCILYNSLKTMEINSWAHDINQDWIYESWFFFSRNLMGFFCFKWTAIWE